MKRTLARLATGGLVATAAVGVLLVTESRLGDDLDPVSTTVQVSTPETSPPVPYEPCYSEDEVTVIVESDVYEWEAGHVLCVHRDFLREPK